MACQRVIGVPTEGFILDNGAGLSRSERIRAEALGRLLITAWHRPYISHFAIPSFLMEFNIFTIYQ